MPFTPEFVTANRAVFKGLADLDVSLIPNETPWFTIDNVGQPRQIGRDGTGGAIALMPSQSVLYVSADGRAGIVAVTFEAFIQLVVAHPYWRDILKFSAGGDLQEMRRAAEWLEAAQDDEDEVNEARETICRGLDLREANDPVAALYEAVASSDAVVRAPDGNPCTTLFNRFGIDDNPLLRTGAP